MNRVEKYKNILESFILKVSEDYKNSSDGFETIAVIDKERGHFQSVVHGFEGYKRFYTVQFHFDIIDKKVWIQRDITDMNVAEILEEKDIPKEDIILGFKPESSRYLGAYGVTQRGKAA